MKFKLIKSIKDFISFETYSKWIKLISKQKQPIEEVKSAYEEAYIDLRKGVTQPILISPNKIYMARGLVISCGYIVPLKIIEGEESLIEAKDTVPTGELGVTKLSSTLTIKTDPKDLK